jgi:hypothetical protein
VLGIGTDISKGISTSENDDDVDTLDAVTDSILSVIQDIQTN